MRVVWLRRPRAKFEAAVKRIADDDPAAALNQFAEVETQANRLAELPELGRPGREPGCRELSIARTPFVVVYRVRPRLQQVEVFRFLHTRQQWPVD